MSKSPALARIINIGQAHYRAALIAFILSAVAFSASFAFGANVVGPGETTLTCIDRDGDGYGVGNCLGPDADDNDPSIATSSDVLTKYASMDTFLAHLGYNPLRKWYVSTTGNDRTCTVNNINLPCASTTPIKASLKAGDMVLFRAGTYTSPIINTSSSLNGLNGTKLNPIIFMAYPGEPVTINSTAPATLTYSNWTTIDGFEMVSPTNLGYAINFGLNTGIVIRNNHLHNFGTIIHNGGYGVDVTIENNVVHNSYGEHCIYLGNHWDTPSSDIYVKNNIAYNCATTGFQFNGPVTNLQFDSNIVYSTALSPISLLMGVSSSFFRNNLTFNSDRSAVTFFDYNGNCTAGDTQYICPMPMTGNVFEYNTFWIGKYISNWQQKSPYPASVRVGNQPGILFSDSSTSLVVPAHYAAPHDFSGNAFKNNIIVTQEAVAIQFFWASGLDTTLIQNNLFYRADANTNTVAYGGVQPTATTITNYSLAQLQLMYPSNISNNKIGDPSFAAVDPGWWATPGLFNFRLHLKSPAKGIGSTLMTTNSDIRGHPRVTPPTVGAYEIVAPDPIKARRRQNP